MKTHRLRRAVIAVSCVALLPLLTSCFLDPSYTLNPTTIQRQGDSLMIAVCNDLHVNNIRVEGRRLPAKWTELYIATGNADLKTGETFFTDGSVPGLKASIAVAPDFGQINQFNVVLSESETNSWLSVAQFEVPSTGFPDRKWLHSDGSFSETACPG